MARELRLGIDADSSGARRGLDSAARAVDNLGDETRRLQREFAEASREASKLDRKLLETKAAAASLSREFAKTQDKSLLSQIEAHNKAATEIKRVQATIVGDSEKNAKASSKAWKKAFDDLEEMVSNAGGTAFESGGNIFSTLAKNPALAAAAGVVAIPATIGVGAMAGGLIGGGVSGGLAAATIAGAAAQSKAVHRAWSTEIEAIKAEFLSATSPGVEPTVAAIQRIGAAVRSINMDAIFGKAATFIEPLAEGLSKGLTSAGKGIQYLVERSGPYISALKDGAEQIGEGFKIAFQEIGDGADGGGMALRDLGHIIAVTVASGGTFIGWAEDAYAGVHKLSEEMRLLPQVDLMANAMGQGDEPKSFARKLTFDKPNVGPIIDDMGKLEGAAKGAADAMDRINTAFDDMFRNTMDVDRAADAYQQSLADLKKSIQENGTAIEGNSQKARDNRDAIRDVIDKIEEQRQAAIRAGGSTQAAYEQANAVYLQQLESLRTTLVQMHLNTDAVDAMIAKFRQVPPRIDTDFNIHVRIATSGSTNINGQRVGVGEGGTIPIKGAFAEGGPVPGPPGAPALIMAHGGEYVLSRDMLRGAAPIASTGGMARMAGAAGSSTRPVTSLVLSGAVGDYEAMHLSWLQKQIQIGRLQVAA